MSYPLEVKEKAIKLRKNGYSVKEIAKKLGIAQATSSVWLSKVRLSRAAQEKLKKKRILGQYKASFTLRKRKSDLLKGYVKWASGELKGFTLDKKAAQLLCSLLYWAEGAKFTDNRIEFTNSDPAMIKCFLRLLRKGFSPDESKLRANVHIHEYHDDKKQKEYWSKVAGIPLNQFYKSYLKPNTKKRYRENYPGCVRISHSSSDITRKIGALYKEFINHI